MADEALYTAGIVATTTQRPKDVIDALAAAMAGHAVVVANELRVKAGVYEAPVMELTDDDLAGGATSIQVRQPRENLFNVVTGKIIDAAQGWKADVDFPRVPAQAYIDADGLELPLAVTFDAVSRSSQAQQLAAVMLRYERQALTVVQTFKLTAYPLELFDTVERSSARFGWDAKPFVVMGRKWSIEGMIELTLRETDPTIYAFGNLFDETDVAPNTNLPLPTQVQQLMGLNAISGTAELTDGSIVTRTKVTWTPATDQSVLQNGKVEIQWIPATDPFPPFDWPGTTEQGGAQESTIVGLRGGLAYHIRARFIGLGGRIRGRWSEQILHIVALPPQIGGANLLINGSFEIDTANIADHWTPSSGGTTGTVSHSDATGIFGSRAQRVDCTNLGTTSSDRAGYFQGVNVAGLEGEDMALSAYAFGTVGAKLRLVLTWYTSNGGTLLSSVTSDLVLAAEVQRCINVATVPAGCGYCEAYLLLTSKPVAGAAFMTVDAAQFEVGSVATAFSQSADEAVAAAAVALATANAAAADAAAAVAAVNATASDNILSSSEKSTWVLYYANILSERADIDAQAIFYGITIEKDTYDNAVSLLTAYLATLPGWDVIPGSNIAIVGGTWRAAWSSVYNTRQSLLNKIVDEAAKRASWAQVTGAGKPADNASADLVLITRGTCVATGNSVSKVGGTDAWNSDAYSKNGFVGGCFAAAAIGSIGAVQFGLNSDPTTDSNFTSLDYAFYTDSNILSIYQAGSVVAGPFACAVGDVLAIVYDGVNVYWLQNNTLRRTVAAPANLNLFWDSSFYQVSSFPARLDQIRFGPLSAVTGISTGQLVDTAVNETLTLYSASYGYSTIL